MWQLDSLFRKNVEERILWKNRELLQKTRPEAVFNFSLVNIEGSKSSNRLSSFSPIILMVSSFLFCRLRFPLSFNFRLCTIDTQACIKLVMGYNSQNYSQFIFILQSMPSIWKKVLTFAWLLEHQVKHQNMNLSLFHIQIFILFNEIKLV
jgi:hypothetical protein